MLSRLGIDASPAVQYVIAFAVIFGVLALLALGLRRLTAARLSMPGQDRTRARQPRLGIVDVYDLDRQRQLILLRRDNVEHLLLIGGPNDLVVETNIMRVPARAGAPGDNGFERGEHGVEVPARPVVEPPRPSLEGAVSARLGAVSGLGEDTDARAELAPAGASPHPARGRVEPVLKPDPVAPAPPRAPAPAVAARPATAGGQQAGDPSVLSDMAKQLENALRRPAAPAPAQPAAASPARADGEAVHGASSEPARPAPAPPRRPDVVRPAAPTRPVAAPRPVDSATSTDAGEAPAAAADPAELAAAPSPLPPAPAPARAAPSAPPPTPQAPAAATPAAPPPPPAPPAPPPPAAAAPRAGANDPFSVEEIEAEFARLLGRPLEKAENR